MQPEIYHQNSQSFYTSEPFTLDHIIMRHPVGESLIKKFYLSYSEKCPSEHNVFCPSEHAAMCPSKHELCVLPNMKLELRNKCSPLQLAPKPTDTQKGEHNGAEGSKYASLHT